MTSGGGRSFSSKLDADAIYATHSEIRKIVESYREINLRVTQITLNLQENWVGDGRNEFESQYKLLIRKIEDFGDTLRDIYEALVDAEAKYREVDDQIRQDYVMSKNG